MPARPAPAEATLGKPQLWAEGTSCESITGAGRDAGQGWMDNSLLVLVDRLVLGEHRVGQCWEFLGCFWGGWSTNLLLIHQT